VLLLANVILYMPFGFLGVLGWPDHALRVVAAGLGISLLVEISHFTITERVASTDDVLLNTAGLLLGWVLGLVAGKVLARRTASREATGQVDLRGPDALPDA
jgi:glycopeptide antibiotics resistance protein